MVSQLKPNHPGITRNKKKTKTKGLQRKEKERMKDLYPALYLDQENSNRAMINECQTRKLKIPSPIHTEKLQFLIVLIVLEGIGEFWGTHTCLFLLVDVKDYTH